MPLLFPQLWGQLWAEGVHEEEKPDIKRAPSLLS